MRGRDVLPSKPVRRVSERFSAQVVLVTGGTGALGRAVTEAFLEEGALAIVTYRQQSEFDKLRQAAGTDLSRLEGSNTDVTDEPAVHRLVDAIVSKHGRLDVLVNAVGGYAAGRKLWEMEPSVLPQMLSLNLTSGYVLCRAVVPTMLRHDRGTIINVASLAAVHHAPSSAEYAASKSAAVAMIDSMAADLSGTGVRVNSILPSIIDTEANRKAMPGADYSKWPKPQEIARVILFLCSDDARLIHGASIPL
jgi:NAD(P)-dependent dehydrogenase (short-subunit alcohol dehydrogenase family)